MAHRATALALTAAMMAALAAPAFAGVYYIGDGDITVTKTDSGTYVKHSGKNYGSGSLGDKDDGEITIKGGSSKDTQELVDESRPVVAMDEDTGDSENDLTYSDPTPVVTWPDVASDEDDTSEEPVDETTDPEEPESTEEQPEAPAEGEENEGENPENLVSTLEAPAPAMPVGSSKDDDDDSNAVTYESKTPAQVFTEVTTKAASNIIKIINNVTGSNLNVTLDNVNITVSGSRSALTVSGAGDTTITLEGNNELTGGSSGNGGTPAAGLNHIKTGGVLPGTLTITGKGNLTADGYRGIYSGSNLIINSSGTVNANGGGGAGISSSDGTVTIDEGSTVHATSTSGRGISGGTVNITNSTVTAIGGGGIGISGYEGVTITNSKVTATGGNSTKGSGFVGISGYKGVTITNSEVTATGGDSATGNNITATGGAGIRSDNGSVEIKGSDTIINAQGGSGSGKRNTGGAGISGKTKVSIKDATIENAQGGSSESATGGAGICSDNGSVEITGNAQVRNAEGGDATGENGKGGSGINAGTTISVEGNSAVKATAGSGSTNGSAFKQGNTELAPADVVKSETAYAAAVDADGNTTTQGTAPKGFPGYVEPEQPAPETPAPAPVISSDDSDSTPAPEEIVITPAGVQGFWFTGMLGNSISVKADVNGSTMEFSSLRYAAALHTTLGQLRQLKEQGITHITFKTMLCTTTFAIDDLLPLGDDATEVVLSHNGKAATLTVGGVAR